MLKFNYSTTPLLSLKVWCKTVLTTIFVCFIFFAGAQNMTSKTRVLIVDGFSNHDWKQTTALIKAILESSGLFEVSVSTTPGESNNGAWEKWQPNFEEYDVIIQNTNNIHDQSIKWPEYIEKNLEEYLRRGGGLYVFHSANNAFPHWEAYNNMIGLGWRSKMEGKALYIDNNGALKFIPKGEGKSTYHGPRSDEVIHILTTHPINKDFPSSWKTPNMELYKFPRGPAQNTTVLSYAIDITSNMKWPVEWTVAYGKGRVYNSSLGHLWKREVFPDSFKCVGFQTTVIRVTEWLANGTVTFDLPDVFPDSNNIVLNEIELKK